VARFAFYRPERGHGSFIGPGSCDPERQRNKAALVIDHKTGIVYQVVVGLFYDTWLMAKGEGNALDIVRETVKEQEE
jgi:hypothetical protein